jgi:methionine sulfoxide reductase heme-binding subunit
MGTLVAMKPWYYRLARPLVYVGWLLCSLAIGMISAVGSPDLGDTLVAARQLYGLWGLATLLAAMSLGPAISVLPWLPLKAPLMYARRAIGVCGLGFALLHVATYCWSLLRRDWREVYLPGVLWVSGLVAGLIALSDMVALATTSTDAAVKRMGGRKWKRLHRTIHLVLLVVLVHAALVGADFGLNHGPDVKGDADFGCLIGFVSISAVWLILFLLRRRGWRWTPKVLRAQGTA